MSRSCRQYRYRLACTPLVQPRKMSLAACIIRWPAHHPFPGIVVPAPGQVVLQHRPGGLLDLQEQRVLLVAALQQHDERPGADAADPDDLAGHVDDLELLQQVPPVVLQGGPVLPELVVHRLLDVVGGHPVLLLEVPDRDHDRRLADDPVAAVDQFAELGQGLQAVPGARLAQVLLGLLGRPGRAAGRRVRGLRRPDVLARLRSCRP